jgi:tryptophan-rich sensory protein
MNTQIKYQVYQKPSWSPPPSTFGKVWGFLYVTIFITDAWLLTNQDKIGPAVIPLYMLNLAANLLYMPATFLNDNWALGTVAIMTTLISLIAGTIGLVESEAPFWIIALQIPYIIWMIIASVLHVQIATLNDKI